MLLAVVCAALSLCAFAASSAGAAVWSEFFGIAQGQLDVQDRQGMAAARIQTARFMLKWRDIEKSPGSYDWRERDRLIGGLAVKGIRSVPYVWGSPRWVGNGSTEYPPIFSAAEIQSWRNFLTAAVARYGPGGTYWAPGGKYDQDYGTSAAPLPIKSWQVWNEPNLRKYFGPGSTSLQAKANKYARLLAISHDAIKSKDPRATIVLAGMPSTTRAAGSSNARDFLNAIYNVAGVKADFDAAALHPYGCELDQVRTGISQFRAVMENRGDGATPLWLTEFAWGSGPDQSCINKGATGQRQRLISSFRMFLQNRKTWNVQRLFWFLWRDPTGSFATYCSFCGTAGLLRHDGSRKPAYYAFKGFTAETTRPVASITSGPGQGSFIKDPTPTFSFASNEAGSTFVCRFDSSQLVACASPYTRAAALPNGAHTFFVNAIDAPGNVSAVVSRSFTVDTVPPQTTITGGPSDTTTDDTPTFTFSSSESGAAFQCRFDSEAFAPCSGPGASHTPATPLSAGGHNFEVRATDQAKNTDPKAASRGFTVDTAVPETTITSGPSGTTRDPTPTFTFISELGASFQCKIDASPYAACSSPKTTSQLANGWHTFRTRATDVVGNTDPTPDSLTFTVDAPQPPNTKIHRAKINRRKHKARFAFSSSERGSTFRCKLDRKSYRSCESPKTYRHLKKGRHSFSVKAQDSEAASDPSPAKRHFKIR